MKIFITYNKINNFITNQCITPIQTGRRVADKFFKEIIGDDTGDNISHLYPYYKELTAIYWAWKNYDEIGKPEHIGFMRYNRHFIFNESYFDFDKESRFSEGYSFFIFPTKDDSYEEDIGLNNERVSELLGIYDAIFVKKSSTSACNSPNFKALFFSEHKSIAKDYDLCKSIIVEKFPEYETIINKLEGGAYLYRYNMFVLKKDLFFRYCEFVFSIFEELYEKVETSTHDINAYSTITEFLYSLFVLKVYSEKKHKVKELYTTLVRNCTYKEELLPAFEPCYNAIAVGCSDLYAPYLGVYLQSICHFSSEENRYDIVVLQDDITQENRRKLELIASQYSNVSVRFYDVSYLFTNADLHISHSYFSKHCYYRLSVGKIFEKYKKVLFTDIDLAVNFDVAEMFKLDMGSNPIAACKEILWTPENRKGRIQNGRKIETYITEDLGCGNDYYNTGVMLVDIEKFNQVASFDELLQISLNSQFINQEQCVLNKVFVGKITALPSIYNFEVYSGVFKSSRTSFRLYMKDAEEAKIYHFLTSVKPWVDHNLPYADKWWTFARQTPFYETIIWRWIESNARNANSKIRTEEISNIRSRYDNTNYQMKLTYVSAHMMYYWMTSIRYAIRKAFAFGKSYEKYKIKYESVKKMLREARKLRNQVLKF